MMIVVDPIELIGAESRQLPYPIYERRRTAGAVHRIGDKELCGVCSRDAVNAPVSNSEDCSLHCNLLATQ
jgi:hypothetical protein